MKIKTFEQFNVNEEVIPRFMMEDPGNIRAMRSYTEKEPDIEYVLTTREPIKISTTDDVELAKIQQLFYKHDVKFDIKELQLE